MTSSSLKSELGEMMRFNASRLYSAGIIFFFAVLTMSSALVTYQLYVNYYPQADAGGSGALGGSEGGSTLYFLRSEDTLSKLNSLGLADYNYIDRLNTLADGYRAAGFEVKYVAERDIAGLPTNAALFAFDTVNLSDTSIATINAFLSDGGYLFFNYHFGFHDGEAYRANAAINEITGLEYSSKASYVDTEDLLFISPKILSPLSQRIYPKGYKIGVELYDPLPVFVSKTLTPDAISTNWAGTAPLVVRTENDVEQELTYEESGVLWHGRYGKGNWVYSSLPSYSLFSAPETPAKLTQLMQGIAQAATEPLPVVPYPYLDKDKVVFVSEDTEYKFESFQGFINAANRYRVPVTAFLVAELAEQFPEMVREAARSPYIELGSHSYTHKKITETGEANIVNETKGSKTLIDKIANDDIMGFRPPREEIDEQMNSILSDANFRYVLEKRKDYKYPTIESMEAPLYVIPRSGTDDYQYLVNLDWDADAILQRMIQETEIITYMDGLYSLSIHTHLMAYKKNIKIVERYFEYLNTQPQLTPMTGIDIVTRARKAKQIRYAVTPTRKNFLIRVSNDNGDSVERLIFRAYWPQGKVLGKVTAELVGAEIDYAHNVEQGYTEVTVHHLSPQSALSLIASYE